MKNQIYIEYFESLSQSSPEITIKQMLDFFKSNEQVGDLYQQTILLAGRLNEINREIDIDTVSFSDAKREKAKIRKALLTVIYDIADLPEYSQPTMEYLQMQVVNDLKQLQINKNQIIKKTEDYNLSRNKTIVFQNLKNSNIEITDIVVGLIQQLSEEDAKYMDIMHDEIQKLMLSEAINAANFLENAILNIHKLKAEVKQLEINMKKCDLVSKLNLLTLFLPILQENGLLNNDADVYKIWQNCKKTIR